jgi:hypothetical protein
MKPIYKLAEQIKGIKRLLDLFENAMNVWVTRLIVVINVNIKFWDQSEICSPKVSVGHLTQFKHSGYMWEKY